MLRIFFIDANFLIASTFPLILAGSLEEVGVVAKKGLNDSEFFLGAVEADDNLDLLLQVGPKKHELAFENGTSRKKHVHGEL